MSTAVISKSYLAFSYDVDSGNYFYRARSFNPETGRFLSEDPIGFDGLDENLYRYVFSNPVSFVDYNGERFSLPTLFGIFGAFFDIPTNEVDLATVPFGVGPGCLNEGEDAQLEAMRREIDRRRALKELGIDPDLAQPPYLSVPPLDPNPREPNQPRFTPERRPGRLAF